MRGNRVEKEWGMPRMDRRVFVVGCLFLPLTGCLDPSSGPPKSAPTQPRFLNKGYWRGDVFVVTGGIGP